MTDPIDQDGLVVPTQRRGGYARTASKRAIPISTGVVLPRVVGDPSPFSNHVYRPSRISGFAGRMRHKPTKAERKFERFLLSLNGGALRGRFVMQHVASGSWIIDFFFPEIRLGIEVDGGIHQTPDQIKRDRQKEKDCARFDITLLRVTNSEVFGNEDQLMEKLRAGWRQALIRKNKVIGTAVR